MSERDTAFPSTGSIAIHGAREHNLKNLSLEIPRNRFVVVTGVSGSGKSTLAFDLLFAEGQRRFLDSMNTYARQFVEQLARPDVDLISGLPPTVSIEQRTTRGGGKSTGSGRSIVPIASCRCSRKRATKWAASCTRSSSNGAICCCWPRW